jgi:hypothetical protein
MAKSTAEKTNIRLKAVLDVLAEGVWSGTSLNAGEVLAGAIQRVPFDAQESELLSGGIPRGHKALTTATSKLVKAGWLVKGRSGWTITDDGLRATVAFADADAFAAALKDGTPVPADLPVPGAPADKPAANSAAAAAKSSANGSTKSKASKAAKAAEKAAEFIEDAVAPVVKAVRGKKAAAAAATAVETQESPAIHQDQPAAVAIAGDFNKILGAPEDWAPQYDEAQMKFDPATGVWTLSGDLPSGFYTYKVALNRSWDENYGAFGVFGGANHELHHAGGKVTFTYSHATRDIVLS